MEELFRFMLSRPVQQIEPKQKAVSTTPSEHLVKKLKGALSSNYPLVEINQVATSYLERSDGLHSINELNYHREFQKFAETLTAGADSVTLNGLASKIEESFGLASSELVKGQKFKSDLERLSNVLLINAILGHDGTVSSAEVAKLLRMSSIIECVADDDLSLVENGGVATVLKQTVLLPADIFPITRTATFAQPFPKPGSEGPHSQNEREALLAERSRLRSTYRVLTRVTSEQIATPDWKELRPEEAAKQIPNPSLPPLAHEEDRKEGTPSLDEEEAEANRVVYGSTGPPLLLKPAVMAAMGSQEQAVLKERNLDLTRVSLKTAIDRLSAELQEIESVLTKMDGKYEKKVVKGGGTLTFIGEEIDLLTKAEAEIIKSHIGPVGIGDLLVVKQFLKMYEGRDLAHVENILKGEFRERNHRRARTTEETITVETELKKEEERDQQTTERFEVKREASQVQKEDSSLKMGLTLTGKYGPYVEFKASTDFGSNTAKEESTKVATSYSKEITNKAISRISERRREERILKTVEVFEEKNFHRINNEVGTDHVTGQYQWIDKVYEAQVYNYGKRMLFDFMIPEPAAFLLYALNNQPKVDADLKKPKPFNIKPDELDETNYFKYVKEYEVIGVTPPPPVFINVTKVFEGSGEPYHFAKATEVPIPDGYEAILYPNFNSQLIGLKKYPGKTRYNVSVGGVSVNSFEILNKIYYDWSGLPQGETGTIGVSLGVLYAFAFAVCVEVWCKRKQSAWEAWQLKTYDAISQAYQKQLRDYEEKLAALQVQAAQQIQGRNPLENERLIRAELKKAAISIITKQFYDTFGAIALTTDGPMIDLEKAEKQGKYIRFFEQAFEWEHMMYFFYSYFWGRKNNWVKRMLLQDADPLFTEFVRAGSVRVVVPVRTNFDEAVIHFLETASIWEGGDLPQISSPLYVSIIEEIRERNEAPGLEIPQGDPWDVRVPTSLIILRHQTSLPAWQKNEQGEWIPV